MKTKPLYMILVVLMVMACALTAGPLVGTASAGAQDMIWGVTGVNFGLSGDYSEVFTVDVATGEVNIVAAVGNGSTYSDIALTPNGNVYAVGMDWDGDTGSDGNFYDFYRLDPVTGEQMGSSVWHVFPDNGFRQVNALAAESDSSLLAIEGGGAADPHLLRINLDGSGDLASIDDLGQLTSGIGPSCGVLDLDPFTGKWYGTFEGDSESDIYELNIADPSSSVNVSACDITYAAGFAFLLNGTSVTTAGSWHDKNLYTVDVDTGDITVLYDLSGDLQGNIFGLSSQPESVTTPDTPSGPASGYVGQSLTYSTGGATSNLGHPLEYRFDWGDGAFSTWSSSTSASNDWPSEDVYEIKAQARCATHPGIMSAWSAAATVTITTEPETVSTPDTPSGPASGYVGESLTYSTGGATSNLGHPLEYRFDWGDGAFSTWSSSTSASNDWSSEDTYEIRAQARCATHTDIMSPWSAAATVTITTEPGDETVSIPDTPTGLSSGDPDEMLTYCTGGSVSSLGHPVEYQFDWGDDTYSSWSSSTCQQNSWSTEDTYYVRARARCELHTDVVSGWSSVKIVTIGEAPISDYPPEPPTNLVATGFSDPRIDLSWQDNSDNELGFRVWRKNRSLGFFYEIAAVGANVTTYSDTDVVAGKGCWYMVKAWNYTQGPLGPQETFSEYSNVAGAVAPTGGGCFVASAAFNSYMEPRVETLRTFRDGFLASDPAGKAFVATYYKLSPAVAELIEDHPGYKSAVRAALLPSVGVSVFAVEGAFALKVVTAVLCLGVLVLAAAWLGLRVRRSRQSVS